MTTEIQELQERILRIESMFGISDAQEFDGSLRFIMNMVSKQTLVNKELLAKQCREAHIVLARQLFCWLARTQGYSLQSIGSAINHHHGTVMHAMRSINNRRDTDPAFKAKTDNLLTAIRKCENKRVQPPVITP